MPCVALPFQDIRAGSMINSTNASLSLSLHMEVQVDEANLSGNLLNGQGFVTSNCDI